jgi:DNA modification methylase
VEQAREFNFMNYTDFLTEKVAIAKSTGLPCEDSEIHPILKPHQRDIVKFCVLGGRRAVFAAFGLGKTLIQLEALRLIKEKTLEEVLIVCPLGVRQEFKRDAALIGLDTKFIRSNSEMQAHILQIEADFIEPKPTVWITNYESIREDKIDVTKFGAVSLDEAAILRGFGGTKTFRELMRHFEGTSTFRFVATATPSPNEFIELLAYAAYLGIMEVSEAKTRFFKRDSTQADKLTLHPHKEKQFWLWCASWAIFLQKPSDLGYSDEGYVLPDMDIRWHEVGSDHSKAKPERNGQGLLLNDTTISVQNAAVEKRSSLPERIEKLMELRADGPLEHRLIWHDLESEREAIEKAIPTVCSIFGRKDLEKRENELMEFSDGFIQELAAKPVMAGSGCNFQRHCHWAIFLGIGFKFAEFVQAIHRIHRFLQPCPVRIDLIYTEAEREVRRLLERKWTQHKILVEKMSEIIREFGLAHESISAALKRSAFEISNRKEVTGDRWKLVNNDTILELDRPEWTENSVHLILTSIPFSTQYEYSPAINDLGHNEDNGKFWEQMDFLTPKMYRILKPGRICAIHVKDRITPSGMTGMGFQTVQPLHAEAINHYVKHGFGYLGMKTIVTDVVRENNQTYRLGWTEQCKDGTKMGVGMPEYLLIFRKPPTDRSNGYADEPVIKDKPECTDEDGFEAPFDKETNWKKPIPGSGYSRSRWQLDAHGLARSSGDRLLSSKELLHLPHATIYKMWRAYSEKHVYNFKDHLAVSEQLDEMERLPATFMLLPPHSINPDVWTDVTRMRTLNMCQSAEGRQMHLCPMQYDICERSIIQWTMKDEVVFDPFAGIGSVPMMAVRLGRKGFGVELNPDYFEDAAHYCSKAEESNKTPSLLDLMEAESVPEEIEELK